MAADRSGQVCSLAHPLLRQLTPSLSGRQQRATQGLGKLQQARVELTLAARSRLSGRKTRARCLSPLYLHLSGVNGSLSLPILLALCCAPQCNQYSAPSQLRDLTGCVCHSCADSSMEPITGQVLPLARNAPQSDLQLWLIFAPIGFLFPFPQNVISVSCALPAWESQRGINTGSGGCRTLMEVGRGRALSLVSIKKQQLKKKEAHTLVTKGEVWGRMTH